jgi:hypothetical protein
MVTTLDAANSEYFQLMVSGHPESEALKMSTDTVFFLKGESSSNNTIVI